MKQETHWTNEHYEKGLIQQWEIGSPIPQIPWLESDVADGNCSAAMVGTVHFPLPPSPSPGPAWTALDAKAQRCLPADIGTLKPGRTIGDSVALNSSFSIIDEVPARRLKRDILLAYEALGGVAYLTALGQEDRSTFMKTLNKVLPQAIEADVRMEANPTDLELLPTAQLQQLFLRMMAAKGQTVDANIIDVDTSGSA